MHPDLPLNTQPIRILLVDDHPAIREGLALLLATEGIDVCATASTSAEALVHAEELHPDLALVDLSLGNEDGLLLVADLHARVVPVLVYSMHEDARHVEGAFTAGALGYVSKRELYAVLVDAIREVMAGRRFVSAYAAIALTDHFAWSPAQGPDRELSDQEHRVYRLISQGNGTQAIADTMGISTRTVESYYARILVKLGLTSMRELRHQAITHSRT